MDNEYLYVIIPYFYPSPSESNVQNLLLAINEFNTCKNVKLIIAEGIFKKNKTQLKCLKNLVFQHYKIFFEDVLWIKENLLNIVLQQTPQWKYAAWVDKDIKFIESNWATNTIKELNGCDVLQPFDRCVYLDKRGLHSTEDTNFFNKLDKKKSGTISFCCGALGKGPKNGAAMHPGQAWAINRTFFNKFGKLFERGIIGGGDCVIVEAIRQNKNHPIYKHYGQPFFDFCDNFKDVKIGYVPGTIYHRYHGNLRTRKYHSRMDLFTKYKFDVSTDLKLLPGGQIQLSSSGKHYSQYIENFFNTRTEINY